MLTMDDDVSQSVDALVAESVSDMDTTAFQNEYHLPSRTSTPSVPPGFDLPHAHPAPSPIPLQEAAAAPVTASVSAAKEEPAVSKSGAPTRVPSVGSPSQFTPPRNAASMHVPRVATPLSTVSVPPTPTAVPAVIVQKPNLSKIKNKEQAKEDVKSLASNSGLSKTIAAQASQKLDTPVLQADDFPTLEKVKVKDVAVPSGPRAMSGTAKKTANSASSSTATTPTPATKPTKKPTPGILNITVPTPPAVKEPLPKAASVKPSIESSAFPPLPPSAPAASAVVTTASKGPKTLRVLATPKAESPSGGATPPQSATSSHPPTLPATRQSSMVPSTPASDVISDNASHTSATLSRPSSPPPSRIGSAPVRTTTKSQLKKARKEAMREKTEMELAAEHKEEEEIGPIMGRKKKQKKPKVSTGTAAASSRPQTPKILEKVDTSKPGKASSDTEVAKKSSSPTDNTPPKTDSNKSKSKSKGSPAQVAVPEPPAPSVEPEDESAEKPIPSPAAVLQDLRAHGEIPEPESLALLNPPPAYNHHYKGDLLQELDGKLVITEEDRANLLANRPVHKAQSGVSRIMLTPNGDCVRNLTAEEEEKYLELQQRIFESAGPTAFVPARHNATNGFTLIGGRAVPNGPPSFFPPLDGAQTGVQHDPVGKIQRDEALSYINQYVLPSLSTNSQLERALNASSLDAEMLRPADPQTWASWGAHNQSGNGGETRSGQEVTPFGSNRQDGILANGLESMTAHFAVGRENGRCQPLGNVTLLSLSDSESALQAAKKEHEKLDKSINQFIKKNRRMLLGVGH